MDQSLNDYFARIFVPGAVLLTSGFKGGGKSHTAIAVAERLVKGCYPKVGKVVVLTNMLFFHKVGGKIVEETPPGVHHITTMKEVFPLICDIIEENGRDVTILLILDEAQNFIGGDSNQTNASVMMKEFLGTIRKFRLVVWFLTPSAQSIGPAFRNYLNDPKYPGNVTCKWKKDLAYNEWYISKHQLNATPKQLMLVKNFDSEPKIIRIPVTEWTGTIDTLSEGGYCYDHEASATFYVGDDFDWELFNRTVGGVSSVNIIRTIRSYYSQHHGDAVGPAPMPEPETVRKLTEAEIAVNMLNQGTTEREVADRLGITRDQLRYRLRKAGYERVTDTSADVGKRWVLTSPVVKGQDTKNPTASSLGVCVKGGGFSSPIYISRGTSDNAVGLGSSRHNSHTVSEPSGVPSRQIDDGHESGMPNRGVSASPNHDDPVRESRRIPDGTYSMNELAKAVHWCIGDSA